MIPLQRDRNPVIKGDRKPFITSDTVRLEAAHEKITALQTRLDEQKAMFERLIASKDNEISTLKTSMVMMEQLKRYGALDVGERKPGKLAQLSQWLAGFRKPSAPAASYQQIDHVVESVGE
jgi:hypothetical protein